MVKHTQTIRRQKPSVFDHFVNLARKGLTYDIVEGSQALILLCWTDSIYNLEELSNILGALSSHFYNGIYFLQFYFFNFHSLELPLCYANFYCLSLVRLIFLEDLAGS